MNERKRVVSVEMKIEVEDNITTFDLEQMLKDINGVTEIYDKTTKGWWKDIMVAQREEPMSSMESFDFVKED